MAFINKEINKKEKPNKNLLGKKINDFLLILEIMGFDFSLNEFDKETKKIIDLWTLKLKNKEFIQADNLRIILQKKMII